jgi:hypothetical protein
LQAVRSPARKTIATGSGLTLDSCGVSLLYNGRQALVKNR